MAGFKFRLESILNLRRADRDRAHAALADANEAVRIVERRRAEVQNEVAQMRAHRRHGAGPGEVDPDRILQAQRYEMLMEAASAQFAQQLEQLSQAVVERRNQLMEADRGVRVLEKLRERQLAGHQQEMLRLEARDFDEIASRNAGRTV